MIKSFINYVYNNYYSRDHKYKWTARLDALGDLTFLSTVSAK